MAHMRSVVNIDQSPQKGDLPIGLADWRFSGSHTRYCSTIKRSPRVKMTMVDADMRSVVDGLMPLLRQFPRSEYGIAVGGAHAKGTADTESDLDIYVFSGSILSNAERTRLTNRFSPGIARTVSWGTDSPFVQAGTDFFHDHLKVECWLRCSDHIINTIAECEEGIIKRDFVTWTTTGFYNHCLLSDLKAMIPVDDPSGILAGWKRRIEVYPPKLRTAIIETHLQAARFWPANFHYTSAVKRKDVIYTSGIVQQVVHNLVQVLFAVNEVYFTGDKKLSYALGRLSKLPSCFVERIEQLLMPEQPMSVETLEDQQIQLQRLLEEVDAIVRDKA